VLHAITENLGDDDYGCNKCRAKHPCAMKQFCASVIRDTTMLRNIIQENMN